MAIPLHKAVSSVESIQSSIETDQQVYRWFLMLVTLPDIKTNLGRGAQANLYHKLRWLTTAELAVYGLLGLLTVAVVLTRDLKLLAPALILLILLFNIYRINRRQVAQLGVALLTEDFKAEAPLETHTLFQIGEHYSRRLNIPSLVDTITGQDNLGRKIIIYANVLACFIYPMDFWYIWLTIFSSFYLMRLAVQTSFVFRRLK